MSFKAKLLQFFARYDLNPTSLAKRLNYTSAEKISRLTRDETNLPSYQILQDIINAFPELDARWWFSDEAQELVEDSRVTYGFCKECLKKEGIIEHLKKEVSAKDKRILDLEIKIAGAEGRAGSQGEKSKAS